LDYPLGWETVGGFQKTFEAAGGQVVQKIWAPLGFADFSTQIKSMRKDADAVFISTSVSGAAIFVKQYKEFGPKLPLIGGGASFDETMLRTAGENALGALSVYPYSAALETAANQRFVRSYNEKFGTDPSLFAESAYTSAMVIDKAVQSIKGDVEDKQKLVAALRKVQLSDAPRGPLKMDDRGNPIENFYVRKVQKVNGKFQNTVIVTFKNVSQFWKYKPESVLAQPSYSKDYPPCLHCPEASNSSDSSSQSK
jgi:branched-chain amino acid transport system substrate-binding protein